MSGHAHDEAAARSALLDADYVLRWLRQTEAPENIIGLQQRALDALTRLTVALPCGHPATAATTSREGTGYCGWCADLQRLTVERDNLVKWVEEFRAEYLNVVRTFYPDVSAEIAQTWLADFESDLLARLTVDTPPTPEQATSDDLGDAGGVRVEASEPSGALPRCDGCRHAAHDPGHCRANVGTGYNGTVLCQCGHPKPCYICGAEIRDGEQHWSQDGQSWCSRHQPVWSRAEVSGGTTETGEATAGDSRSASVSGTDAALADACDVAIWLSAFVPHYSVAWNTWEHDMRPRLFAALETSRGTTDERDSGEV